MTARATNPFGIASTSSVVFIDAHPGSSIRTCGGAMLLCKRLGAKIAVIEACDGAAMVPTEAQGPAMAVQRRKEIHAAIDILGLSQKDLFLLGFPDSGLEALRADYWRPVGQPYFCPWLKQDCATSPEAHQPGARFFGQEFFNLLKGLLMQRRPTHVFVHHDRDTALDHRAMNWFVKKALADLCFEGVLPKCPPLFEWLTYYTRQTWPPKGPDITLAAAKTLPFPGEIVRYVPPPAEQKVKVSAWRQCLPSHGPDYVKRWTKSAEVFWLR
jgi:LmbE family N-acetylglucosaminyl deacetylase